MSSKSPKNRGPGSLPATRFFAPLPASGPRSHLGIRSQPADSAPGPLLLPGPAARYRLLGRWSRSPRPSRSHRPRLQGGPPGCPDPGSAQAGPRRRSGSSSCRHCRAGGGAAGVRTCAGRGRREGGGGVELCDKVGSAGAGPEGSDPDVAAPDPGQTNHH